MGATAWARAEAWPDVAPPAWTDEPPQLSRWIEEGWATERASDPATAAARYCDAARFGSGEAYYRLGALFLRERRDPAGEAEGWALLRQAAQIGHRESQGLLEQQSRARDGPSSAADTPAVPVGAGRPDDLPACLTGGEPPRFDRPPPEQAVPHEVVERFVAALPPDKRRHAQLIQRLAPRFAVDGRLALAIARAESNFEARAVSPRNAQGLMQLIPDTAERFGVRNPFDPEQNVRGGLSYLRWLLDRFDGDVALVCAAYNAGEGVVDRYGGVPPYPETRAYVQRILHFYRATRHPRPGAL
ncbi:lytic transglycosylase domain-containing protein [Tepidimonas sp.]|uniref:lytic transglycosylase domain-containing protein n=1 Tax=Tepidimonas sp. TaxID=2002775 RepID=UPI002FE17FBD